MTEARPAGGGKAVDTYSRWVHRSAVALTVSVFPLIWVGGLVTTYGAGMAVPDWPGTYGWNMFLYPPSTWLYGGFDLMVEHGHRLLGSLAGLIAILLLVVAVLYDRRRWFKAWCGLVLLAVIAQGVLGGVRVLLDERVAALIHGCTAQLFLSMATATAVMSSRWWIVGKQQFAVLPAEVPGVGKGLVLASTLLLLVAYMQVIAGAHLRHVTGDVLPGRFMGYVHIHLSLAALVLLATFCSTVMACRAHRRLGGVKWPALLILGAVCVQLGLGCATWLVNYALPWQESMPGLAGYTIQSKGFWESLITTAHVATGAVIISLATLLCLRAWRGRAWMRGKLT
jgi:cytochrome c oxidase assembly protein subunit 15